MKVRGGGGGGGIWEGRSNGFLPKSPVGSLLLDRYCVLKKVVAGYGPVEAVEIGATVLAGATQEPHYKENIAVDVKKKKRKRSEPAASAAGRKRRCLRASGASSRR